MGLTSLRLLKYKDRDSSIEITDTSGIKKNSTVAVLEGKIHAYTESKITVYGRRGHKLSLAIMNLKPQQVKISWYLNRDSLHTRSTAYKSPSI